MGDSVEGALEVVLAKQVDAGVVGAYLFFRSQTDVVGLVDGVDVHGVAALVLIAIVLGVETKSLLVGEGATGKEAAMAG